MTIKGDETVFASLIALLHLFYSALIYVDVIVLATNVVCCLSYRLKINVSYLILSYLILSYLMIIKT